MSEEQIICKCPVCEDGNIIDKGKLFSCTNNTQTKNEESGEWEQTGTCTYKVFKSGLSKLGHGEITSDELRAVVEEGEFEFDLVSKGGKPYTGKGVVDTQWGIKINFN